MRTDRPGDRMRPVTLTRDYVMHPEGSVLCEFGNTKVLCNASFSQGVPPFLKDSGRGWVTAEYAMLPRATNTRNQRESKRGKEDGRTMEISRLIGRSLRAAVDFEKLGENTIIIDCDVLQADGGTRTAAITGGFCALYIAAERMVEKGVLAENPVQDFVGAVSIGIVDGLYLLDLQYTEDSAADVDLNLVMKNGADIIEIQGCAEGAAFSRDGLDRMLDLGVRGIENLLAAQKRLLGLA